MKDVRAKILSNKRTAPNYYKMALDAGYIAASAKPGQFVEIKCSDALDPLLRRPFSIHRVKARKPGLNIIEILYEVVGRATQILARKKQGEFLKVLGPLGNGFTLPRRTNTRPSVIIIAGGIGSAPLVFLAEIMAMQKIQPIVLIGAKTKKLILCENDFRRSGAILYIATDDGTSGYKGFVSGLLKKVIKTENNIEQIAVYACGPGLMLSAISNICIDNNIECQVSLETHMACGFGACLGCAVRLKDSVHKLVCKDGPVFNAANLVWDK